MLLVVDSGSTKADWAYYDPNAEAAAALTRETSIGINPNLHSDAEMTTVIESVCPEHVPEAKVLWVYYYGTGIWDHRRGARIERILRSTYPRAQVIEVHHDLLGAARAACGAEPGVACILGTGSNSCLYDGREVTDSVTNLGWLIGDEGSGVDLGRRLLRRYAYRELPSEDAAHFEDATGHNRVTIGDGLYGPGHANRFMASFSPFIHDNLDRPAIRGIVEEAFREFLRRHVSKYPTARELPVSFVGSIAYHYADVLRDVCAAEGLRCDKIAQKPIDALLDFHRTAHR